LDAGYYPIWLRKLSKKVHGQVFVVIEPLKAISKTIDGAYVMWGNNNLLKVYVFALLIAMSAGSFSVSLPASSEDENFYFSGEQSDAKVKLGQLLFFDKVLSGNLNISCATCHHSLTGTGDGLSLSVGEGANGLGISRNTGVGDNKIHARVPRNAPPIFNLGAKEFHAMYYDGRVQVDTSETSGFTSPAGNDLPLGLDNVLAAQAMFPVTSSTEMAGQNGENDQANFSATGNFPALWDFIANKLQAVPEYVDLFSEAFLDVNTAEDITYVHAANAIAAFEAVVWRFDNAPFDVYLRGDNVALSKQQASGLKLFYGIAGCSTCHSGTYQTDQQFHAIAMPQIGPGKGDGDWGREDFGRERVTGNNDDRFKFRTPTLRNIALTAPYGHSGAFNSLETIVRHHLNAVTSLNDYDFSQAVLPSREDLDEVDDYVMSDPFLVGDLAARNELSPVSLSDDDVMDIVAFLYALTDPAALDLRNDTPKSLPSGSPLFD